MNTHRTPAGRPVKLSITLAASLVLTAASLSAAAADRAIAAPTAAPATPGIAVAAAQEAWTEVVARGEQSSRHTTRELSDELNASEARVAAALAEEMRVDIARRSPALVPDAPPPVDAIALLDASGPETAREATPAAAQPAAPATSTRDSLEHTRVYIAIKDAQTARGALVQ
jgi:hypothetical protein